LIGKHRGVPFYTIGQRHGFEIFKYTGKPLYIIEKDAKTNSLVVGDEVEALKLFFTVSEINFITEDFINLKLDILVRVRHLGQLHEANVSFGEGSAKVELKNPVFGIAPGQSCVFYTRDSQVLGGGIIN
jgi:tRNA-specific 2-thiouridylase